MALFRRFFVPADGLVFIFFHAQPVDIAEPEVELRGGVSLFRGFLVPVKGLVIILRSAYAVGISPAEVELGRDVAELRGLLVAVEGFLLVFHNPAPLLITDRQLEQRLGIALQGCLLKCFYVDGVSRDGAFQLAAVVGSVIHFTGTALGEHWNNSRSPELCVCQFCTFFLQESRLVLNGPEFKPALFTGAGGAATAEGTTRRGPEPRWRVPEF